MKTAHVEKVHASTSNSVDDRSISGKSSPAVPVLQQKILNNRPGNTLQKKEADNFIQPEVTPDLLQAQALPIQKFVLQARPAQAVQAKFHAPIPDQGDEWNDLIDRITNLDNIVDLPNMDEINEAIAQGEMNWYGDDEHSAGVLRFNAFVSLKYRVRTGLTELRRNRLDANALDWGDFITEMNTLSLKYGVVTGPVSTGGHPSDTYTYTVGGNSISLAEETDAHGQTAGNLNTRRGQMRNVFDLFNGAVDADIATFQ
jgi:hypothetical protein